MTKTDSVTQFVVDWGKMTNTMDGLGSQETIRPRKNNFKSSPSHKIGKAQTFKDETVAAFSNKRLKNEYRKVQKQLSPYLDTIAQQRLRYNALDHLSSGASLTGDDLKYFYQNASDKNISQFIDRFNTDRGREILYKKYGSPTDIKANLNEMKTSIKNAEQAYDSAKKSFSNIFSEYDKRFSPSQMSAGKKAAQEAAKKGMKESDKLFSKLGKYSKVALGFGATAWLVNKLSDTRGQQTNAQLYGQQQYY